MKDEVIFEALKLAIVEAFFSQKNYYNPATGQNSYYGGQIQEVIRQILQWDETKKLIEEVTKGLKKKQEEIKQEVVKQLKAKVEGEIACYLQNQKVYFSEWVRQVLEEVAKPQIQASLGADEGLKRRIQKQINAEDYNLHIEISVIATKKGGEK